MDYIVHGTECGMKFQRHWTKGKSSSLACPSRTVPHPRGKHYRSVLCVGPVVAPMFPYRHVQRTRMATPSPAVLHPYFI